MDAMSPQPRFHSRVFLFVAFAAVWPFCSLPATEGPIGGFISGFVFDPQGRGLRPVLGIPGSATLGKPLNLGVDLVNATISPAGDYALGFTRDRKNLVQVERISGLATVRVVMRGASSTNLVAISPMGGEAVLYRRAAHTYQVLTNMAHAPEAGEELPLPRPRGSLTAIAVGDEGVVLAGFSDGESGAIYLLGSGGRAGVISHVRHPSAITFLSRSHEALVADSLDNRIYLLRNITANVATVLIAGKHDGVDGPVAVEASRDGKRAFVANAHAKTILTVDLAGGPSALYACHCVPASLSPLNGNALYQLTEPSEGPMWLFDGDAAEPRIVFVPAPVPGSGSKPGMP